MTAEQMAARRLAREWNQEASTLINEATWGTCFGRPPGCELELWRRSAWLLIGAALVHPDKPRQVELWEMVHGVDVRREAQACNDRWGALVQELGR